MTSSITILQIKKKTRKYSVTALYIIITDGIRCLTDLHTNHNSPPESIRRLLSGVIIIRRQSVTQIGSFLPQL